MNPDLHSSTCCACLAVLRAALLTAQVLSQAGPLGFYSGFGVNYLKGLPSGVIGVFAADVALDFLSGMRAGEG